MTHVSRNSRAILMCGSMNTKTGVMQYGTVGKDIWDEGTLVIVQKQEWFPQEGKKPKFEAWAGSGSSGETIGEVIPAHHDQSRREKGEYKVIEFIPVNDLTNLQKYGRTISCGCYK